MKISRINSKVLLFFIPLVFSACNNESNISNSNNSNISGYAQKGPFKKDSLVKAYKLENGLKTNQTIETTTSDNKGSYTLDIPWNGPTLVEISGDYFDEVNGNYITNGFLSSIVNAKANEEVKSNINILTHIASKNIIETLKTTPQTDIDIAIKKADTSVAKVFNLDLENSNLRDLDLTNSTNNETKKANAQLLKISATILSTSNPDDVIEKISEDLRTDGEIDEDGVTVFNEVKTKEQTVNLDNVSNNLETNLGLEDIPDNNVLEGTLTLQNNINFTSKANVQVNTNIESKKIVVEGVIGNAPISITNGEFQLDNGSFTSEASTISNNQSLKVRHTSSNEFDKTTTTVLTIAGVDFEFVSTTKANNIEIVVSDAVYSTTNKTKENVTVTFTTSNDIVTPSGWNKNVNEYSKTYSVNTTETVEFSDTIGNSTSKTVTISNIDKTAPVVSNASYSTTDLTNQDVVVTFTSSNDDIITPNGWTKSSNTFTKSFSTNTNEKVSFSDDVGNITQKDISISNIDNIAPKATIAYSTTDATNKDVTVTITLSEEVNTVNEWSKNGKVFTKTFSSNVQNQSVSFTDLAGNSVNAIVNIGNIDKTKPVLNEVVYSTTQKTNADVTATFTSNENLVAPSGWTKTENSGTFTYKKVYSQNATETVTFSDNVGNSVSKNISITNIDKIAPTATVEYSTTSATNKDVIVTITLNEEVNDVDGWTKNGKVFTKTFSANVQNQTVTFSDLAGNNLKKTVNISNIDKNSPTISNPTYSTTIKTKDDVTVTFTSSDSDLVTPSGWTKSTNNFTKSYSSNVNETVTFVDNAGNEVNRDISISNIDKTAPAVSDASYSEEASTRDPIVVTFISNDNDVVTPSGWAKTGNKFTKTYTTNITENVVFLDDVGNSTTKTVTISNVDTSNPNLISFNGKDYIKVTSPKTGKIWLDRNLGANEVCNGNNSDNCIGDYYQWGRKTNGHEIKNSATSNELITSDVSSDGKFITPESSPYHWEDSQKSTDLWNGVSAINNVCPTGFKVPTKYELEAEFVKESTENPKDSFLKVPASSYRNKDGSMYTSSTNTYLWTNNTDSSIISFDGFVFKFDDRVRFEDENTSLGIPVRCIKDYEDTQAPIISNVKIGNTILNNGATNVSVTDDITIEFSEEIRAEDISSSTISLKRSSSYSKTPKYANKIVTFSKGNDNELLERGYEYTLTVSTSIKDITGNTVENEYSISFETIPAPDTTLPMLDFVNSTLGSYSSDSKNSNVSVSNDIKIVFNENIDSSTINKSNILLNNGANYSVSLQNNKELIISFDSNLSYETTYELELKQGIQDLAGNALNPSTFGNSAGNKTITFTTEDAPDLTAPQVISSNPASSSSDFAISSNILITFDEEIKDYNSTSVVLKKDIDDSTVTTTLTYNNKVLTVNPDNDLEESTAYKLTLTTGIKDNSNNTLANNVEITFTTGTSSSCAGSIIDNICYEVSTTKKTWEDAKNTCESENKTLVQKDSISDWVDMASASKLNLSQDENYWLFEGEAGSNKQSTYLRYSQWSSTPWGTTTAYNSDQKLYICKKDSVAPTASLTKPTSTSDVSTKASFKITFNEDVKNINTTNIVLKDNMDATVASTVTYENKVATIKASTDLTTSTTYTITLKDGITDLYNNKLVEKNYLIYNKCSCSYL